MTKHDRLRRQIEGRAMTRNTTKDGGDLAALVREAGLLAIEDAIVDDEPPADPTIGRDHFERALAETSPSTRDGRGNAEPPTE